MDLDEIFASKKLSVASSTSTNGGDKAKPNPAEQVAVSNRPSINRDLKNTAKMSQENQVDRNLPGSVNATMKYDENERKKLPPAEDVNNSSEKITTPQELETRLKDIENESPLQTSSSVRVSDVFSPDNSPSNQVPAEYKYSSPKSVSPPTRVKSYSVPEVLNSPIRDVFNVVKNVRKFGVPNLDMSFNTDEEFELARKKATAPKLSSTMNELSSSKNIASFKRDKQKLRLASYTKGEASKNTDNRKELEIIKNLKEENELLQQLLVQKDMQIYALLQQGDKIGTSAKNENHVLHCNESERVEELERALEISHQRTLDLEEAVVALAKIGVTNDADDTCTPDSAFSELQSSVRLWSAHAFAETPPSIPRLDIPYDSDPERFGRSKSSPSVSVHYVNKSKKINKF